MSLFLPLLPTQLTSVLLLPSCLIAKSDGCFSNPQPLSSKTLTAFDAIVRLCLGILFVSLPVLTVPLSSSVCLSGIGVSAWSEVRSLENPIYSQRFSHHPYADGSQSRLSRLLLLRPLEPTVSECLQLDVLQAFKP